MQILLIQTNCSLAKCVSLTALSHLPLHSAKDIKHKISFLLQKPEPQAADQKQMKEKNAVTAATAAAAKRSEELISVTSICLLFKIFVPVCVYSSDPGLSFSSRSSKREFNQIHTDYD